MQENLHHEAMKTRSRLTGHFSIAIHPFGVGRSVPDGIAPSQSDRRNVEPSCRLPTET